MIIWILFLITGCTSTEVIPEAETFPVTSGLTVRFLNVGQADAALLSCDGYHILIDGGNKDDSSYLFSLMQSHNISKLDLVIGTHADEDHIGGIPGALYASEATEILCSTTEYDSEAFQDFKTYASLRGGGIRIPEIGEIFTFGDLSLEILAVNSGTESNDSSIVTKVTYGNTSFLFTGDAEAATEQFLLNSVVNRDIEGSGNSLKSTVLKVAHHGSGDSTSSAFLQAVDPDYAVISVDRDNPYGHPAKATLKRLEQEDIHLYRTDIHGEITFFSDGNRLTVAAEYENEILRNPISEPETDSAGHDEITYIVNVRSKKFHRKSCDSVSKMSDQNKLLYTGTREDAIALNFDPCGACKP